MKKYMDIERVKSKYFEVFSADEQVIVQTKVDGANCSLRYNPETNEIDGFSRNQQVTTENTLSGFYDFVKTIPVEEFKEITHSGRYIIFGEWLVKNKIKYAPELYKQMYMFDVWDTHLEQYLTFNDVYKFYIQLSKIIEKNFHIVPTVYKGRFGSWDTMKELMSMSTLGGTPCEEGIVIKSQDRLHEKHNSNKPTYLKLVNDQFSEVQKVKPIDMEKIKEKEREQMLVRTVVTDNRIDKILSKKILEGVIPENWDETNMKDIAHVMPTAIYQDCVKEEPEIVEQVKNFGKICGSLVMGRIKKLLKERNQI